MSGRVQWANLEEFRVALHDVPVLLRGTALRIVDQATDDTFAALYANYPRGETGNLRGGIRVHKSATDRVILNEVASTAPHAHLWEYGTENRKTKKGFFRGRVIPARARGLETLRSLAARFRRRMLDQLAALKDLTKVAA